MERFTALFTRCLACSKLQNAGDFTKKLFVHITFSNTHTVRRTLTFSDFRYKAANGSKPICDAGRRVLEYEGHYRRRLALNISVYALIEARSDYLYPCIRGEQLEDFLHVDFNGTTEHRSSAWFAL
jgi:hypothetical protein